MNARFVRIFMLKNPINPVESAFSRKTMVRCPNGSIALLISKETQFLWFKGWIYS
jgi:hypothetical protein